MDQPWAAPPYACYRHPDRPTRLACSECGRLICVECSRDAVVGQKCPECTTPEQRTRVIPVRSVGHLDRRATPVTWALIGVNTLLFAVQEFFPRLRITARAAHWPALVDQGEWWRLFTAMFLHGGVLHIIFNMYVLWLFGPVLERRFGSPSYASLYLAGGVAGGMFYQMFGSGAPAVGASGAIFGLFGALLAASYRQRHTRAGAAVFGQLGVLLAINLALPLFVPRIAWQAHLGGLVAGILIAAAWDRMPVAGRGAAARRIAIALFIGGAALLVVLLA
ncbi:MAG: rhomboid family intramembrane serine protease [Actinobacteria bacterium]|nr:rhomboid family intramembrane serine protease [Actinomycetota bacterium]